MHNNPCTDFSCELFDFDVEWQISTALPSQQKEDAFRLCLLDLLSDFFYWQKLFSDLPGCLRLGLSWFNWWVSFAPEFLCCYFCESSCLFYLSFNFDFYVSKIMHL